jgi:hypothetical protein
MKLVKAQMTFGAGTNLTFKPNVFSDTTCIYKIASFSPKLADVMKSYKRFLYDPFQLPEKFVDTASITAITIKKRGKTDHDSFGELEAKGMCEFSLEGTIPAIGAQDFRFIGSTLSVPFKDCYHLFMELEDLAERMIQSEHAQFEMFNEQPEGEEKVSSMTITTADSSVTLDSNDIRKVRENLKIAKVSKTA